MTAFKCGICGTTTERKHSHNSAICPIPGCSWTMRATETTMSRRIALTSLAQHLHLEHRRTLPVMI